MSTTDEPQRDARFFVRPATRDAWRMTNKAAKASAK